MSDLSDNDRGARHARAVRTAILLGVTVLFVYGLYIYLVYRAGPAG
jgi:hypothetical protein